MPLLFVYGTLKRGDCRNYLLQNQNLVGEATTVPGYRLFDLGAYPGLVEDPSGGSVRGELYDISADQLPALDEEEGTDIGLYRRTFVPLAPPHDGQEVLTYVYLGDVCGRSDLGGYWRPRGQR